MKILAVENKPFHELLYRTTGDKEQESYITLPFYKVKVDAMPKGIKSFIATSDLHGREQNKESNRLVGEAAAEELVLLLEIGNNQTLNVNNRPYIFSL
jgi:hypothetical protein